MKINRFFVVIMQLAFIQVQGQHFIDKATVEYEVKTNIKKTMGSGFWAEMFKEKMPDFKTGYYNLIFSKDKSVYKFDHWDNGSLPKYLKEGDEENAWYLDRNTDQFTTLKNVGGANINLKDSIPKIKWKLVNENRMIAGFNCRKAEAVIFDSVYVFAFYTEEIIYPGGPCSINGLPGLIMGLTIPRLYTSWIATKVMLTGVDEKSIKPASAKKPINLNELRKIIAERSKKNWTGTAEEDKEYQEQMAMFLWTSLL